MHVPQMISTHPKVRGQTDDALIRCIEARFDCAQTCTACADACLAEAMVKDLTHCIRFNLDCAAVCLATGTVGSRRTGTKEQIIKAAPRPAGSARRPVARPPPASRPLQ